MAKYIDVDRIKKLNLDSLYSQEARILNVSIDTLPSIDPQEMIKKELENCWNLSDSFNEKMVGTTREKLLKELINKLP